MKKKSSKRPKSKKSTKTVSSQSKKKKSRTKKSTQPFIKLGSVTTVPVYGIPVSSTICSSCIGCTVYTVTTC